jgi:hypothetical protein
MSACDAILTYHDNPHTCGVARFNHELAKRLGVPCYPLVDYTPLVKPQLPLVSIKASELPFDWRGYLPRKRPYVLLLHDRPDNVPSGEGVRVLYADELPFPAMVNGQPDRAAINVLLFGMAHKRAATFDHLRKMGDLLARQPLGWTVSVSQAVHEGSPWDQTWFETERALRDLFGFHLRVLGYLADDALAKELREATACALFFDPAARANNTTVWAALDAKTPLITNLDIHSPSELVHGQTCFDVGQMTEWPLGFARMLVARQGQIAASGRTWERLIEVLRVA